MLAFTLGTKSKSELEDYWLQCYIYSVVKLISYLPVPGKGGIGTWVAEKNYFGLLHGHKHVISVYTCQLRQCFNYTPPIYNFK